MKHSPRRSYALALAIVIAVQILGPGATWAVDGTSGNSGAAQLDAETDAIFDSQWGQISRVVQLPNRTATYTHTGHSTVTESVSASDVATVSPSPSSIPLARTNSKIDPEWVNLGPFVCAGCTFGAGTGTTTTTAHGTGTLTINAGGGGTLYAGRNMGFLATATASETRFITASGTTTKTATAANSAANTVTVTGTGTVTSNSTLLTTYTATSTFTATGTLTHVLGMGAVPVTATVTMSSTDTIYSSLTKTATQTTTRTDSYTATGSRTYTATGTFSRTSTSTGPKTYTATMTATVSGTYTGTQTDTLTFTATGGLTGTATASNTSTVSSATVASNPTLISLAPTQGGDLFFSHDAYGEGEVQLQAYPVAAAAGYSAAVVATPTPDSPDHFGPSPQPDVVYWWPNDGAKRRYVTGGFYTFDLWLKSTAAAYVTVSVGLYDATNGSSLVFDVGTLTLPGDSAFHEYQLMQYHSAFAVPATAGLAVQLVAHAISGTPTVTLGVNSIADGYLQSSLNWPLNLYTND
jgi:hypothetical protein